LMNLVTFPITSQLSELPSIWVGSNRGNRISRVIPVTSHPRLPRLPRLPRRLRPGFHCGSDITDGVTAARQPVTSPPLTAFPCVPMIPAAQKLASVARGGRSPGWTTRASGDSATAATGPSTARRLDSSPCRNSNPPRPATALDCHEAKQVATGHHARHPHQPLDSLPPARALGAGRGHGFQDSQGAGPRWRYSRAGQATAFQHGAAGRVPGAPRRPPAGSPCRVHARLAQEAEARFGGWLSLERPKASTALSETCRATTAASASRQGSAQSGVGWPCHRP